MEQENGFFDQAYHHLALPVLVCGEAPGFVVLYENPRAQLLLRSLAGAQGTPRAENLHRPLPELLGALDKEALSALLGTLDAAGHMEHTVLCASKERGHTLCLSLSAHEIRRSQRRCFLFTLTPGESAGEPSALEVNHFLSNLFRIAYHSERAEDAIFQVLAYTGAFASLDRVVVFEESAPAFLFRTCEWCAPGIPPASPPQERLPKAETPYQAILDGKLFFRQERSGQPTTTALALPLMDGKQPLGYLGFYDETKDRTFSPMEVALLRSVTSIVLSLLTRRNADRQALRTLEILRRITDNTDNIVYVNDPFTYELVFVNKTLADGLGAAPEDLIGQPCWKVLQKHMTGPCPFCPIPKLLDEAGQPTQEAYTWEFANARLGKWFLLRDSLFQWIDGKMVHIESGTDISPRKAYEEKLVRFASYDSMTGAFNREWGYKLMRSMHQSPTLEEYPVSVIFIDLDGLKQVNDRYGHVAGDRMILDTVAILRACVRKDDMLCRWGGDEFILAIQCDEATAHRIMQKVLRRLSQHNQQSGEPYQLSLSYGIAMMSRQVPLDALISRADQNMYSHKTEKRMESAGSLSLSKALPLPKA